MIRRFGNNPRMRDAVVHGQTAYLRGFVPHATAGGSIEDQTRDVLEQVDTILEQAGSARSLILQASIWLTDVGEIDRFNAVWDDWIDQENPPARACVEARLARPGFSVEVSVIAALADS